MAHFFSHMRRNSPPFHRLAIHVYIASNRTTVHSILSRLRFSAASRIWESKVPPSDVDTPNTVRHGVASSSCRRG